MAFQTVERALDGESLPMRLYEKAKRLGVWNPSDIDLTRDRKDWPARATNAAPSSVHATAPATTTGAAA